MSRISKLTNALSGNKSKTGKSRSRLRRAFDLALVIAAAAVLVYTVSVVNQVASGYSAEEPTPRHVIRLAVVDATDDGKLVGSVKQEIRALSDMELSVEIVETATFDVRSVERSFIISRQENLTAARLLAKRLGLDPSEVEYKPLVNNRKHVTATLVLGSQGIYPVTEELT
jgi:hypothetical protein